MIGHTQPRRLAARTVAERIAAEPRRWATVGYQVQPRTGSAGTPRSS